MFTRQTYANQAAEYLKKLIRDGELLPGDPLKEVEMADRLGISRAPIREAFQVLVHEGLADAEPQKGKRIRKASDKEILDSYTVGGILEGAGVALSLSSWTQNDVEELENIVKHMHTISQKSHCLGDLIQLDDAFHAALLRHCDNSTLIEMARFSCVTFSKFLYYRHWLSLYTPEGFVIRHQQIVQTIRRNNASQIESMIRDHYREIGLRMAASIA